LGDRRDRIPVEYCHPERSEGSAFCLREKKADSSLRSE
jgi:hypothetical protein